MIKLTNLKKIVQSDRFIIIPLEQFLEREQFVSSSRTNELNEIFFITNGNLIRKLNKNMIQINRYDLHLSLRGQEVAICDYSENPEGYYCAFGNDFFEGLFLKESIVKDLDFINGFMYRYPLRLTKPVYERLLNIFVILEELFRAYDKNKSLIHSYLVVVICEVKQMITNMCLDLYPTKSFFIVRQYNELLEKHITSQRDIDFYASQLGISPNHLNKSVKAATGKTAVGLRNEIILQEAKLQIRQSKASMEEIAFELGFSDVSYFCRFFKKATGYSPLKYRGLKN